MVIGDISPPLTEMELKVLNEDPSFCLDEKVDREGLAISLEEGKIKRIWSELNRYPVAEGEDQPSAEELDRIKELEDEQRRIYDYDEVAIDYGNQRATDSQFSRRLIMPKQKFPKLEAIELARSTVINKTTNS